MSPDRPDDSAPRADAPAVDQELLLWLRDRALADGRVSPGDMDLLLRADWPAEVLALVQEGHRRQRAQADTPRRRARP
jgi:hypothetical protein